MPTLLSPGVSVQEKDFSAIIPAVSSSVGGMVGRFTQGPIMTPVLISSEDELRSTFGPPNDTNANDWFTIASFLSYTNACWVVRSAQTCDPTTGLPGAVSGEVSASSLGIQTWEYPAAASPFNIINASAYETIESTPAEATALATEAGQYVAKVPGASGNGLSVVVVDKKSWTAFSMWTADLLTNGITNVDYSTIFPAAPGTSTFVSSKSVASDATSKNDEVHILVLDVSGNVTGTPYTVLESWAGLSKAVDAVNYQGLTTYYVNVINNASQYVWWAAHPVTTNPSSTVIAWGTPALSVAQLGIAYADIHYTSTPGSTITTQGYPITTSITGTQITAIGAASGFVSYPSITELSGGGAGTLKYGASDIINAYMLLNKKDLYDVSLLMSGAFGGLAGTYALGTIENSLISNIATVRKDLVVFMSAQATPGTPVRDTTTNPHVVVAAFKTAVALDDTSGTYGFMDTGFKYVYDRYSYKYRWVPLNGDIAGLAARTDNTNDPWWSFAGFNRGGIKNTIKFAYNPDQAQRDYLYPKGINPCIMDPSSGPTLFGDRTMTTKPSAFDRINVRRLFIVLEKAISLAAKYELFEFNDAFTQAQFKNMIVPFLKGVQGKRGITDFSVICDASNNPGQVVDSNQFVCDIYIKPARSINFISLSFIATRSDVSFSSVVGA